MAQDRTQSVSRFKANEAAVLSSMILDNAVIPDVLLRLREESFVLPENRLIFRGIQALWFHQTRLILRDLKPQVIDCVVLRDKLCAMGLLENNSALDQAGGIEYIRDVLESCPSAANALYYAELVRGAEKDRQIQGAAAEITGIAQSPGEPDEKLQEIQALVLDLEPLAGDQRFVNCTNQAGASVFNLYEQGDTVQTGFARIDNIIGGFASDDFGILGARPNMGKTSLALNIAYNVARAGKSVLVFSLEMRAERLIQRLLCTLARVDYNQVKLKNQGTEKDRERLYFIAQDITENPLPLTIVDSADTTAAIHAMIRQHRQVADLGLVIVDYIQLLSAGHREKDLRHTVTEISKNLKRITRKENVPVLALSQLSRAPEGRTDFRPRMADLRESGALEQDADIVMLLHREEYYHRGDRDWREKNIDKIALAELIVDKNRSGPTGVADLIFCAEFCQFTDKAFVENDDIPI